MTALKKFVVTVIYCSADAISKYEEEKEKLFMRYEQLSEQQDLKLFPVLSLETTWLVYFQIFREEREEYDSWTWESLCK